MSSEHTSESLIRNISFVLYAKTTAGIPQGATLLPMLLVLSSMFVSLIATEEKDGRQILV